MSFNGISQTYQPLSLNGINTGNFNNIYINGVLFDPTAVVPYTGATKPVDLGSNELKTSYVPSTGPDVINKTYSDANLVPYIGSTSDTTLGTYKMSSSSAPTTGNNFTNKTYVDTATALLVPYIGSTADLQLASRNFTQTTGTITTNGISQLNATASTVPIYDASKSLISSSIPSSYITGFTSDPQTQLNGKGGLASNNMWGNGNTNNFNNALKTVNAPFTNNNPGINAESITAVSGSTYTLVSGFWRFVSPSATSGSVQLPGDFTYGATANQKYILTLTGCSTNGTAPVVGIVYNSTTGMTVSDAPQTITSTAQTITITFTVGTASSVIFINFTAGSTNYYVQWSALSITQANTEVVGALQLDSPIISNIIQAIGTSTNLAGGLLVNQISMGVSASTFTQTGMPSGAPTSTLSYSAPTYTLTASGTFATWLGSATTYISGAKYYFTFGMMLGSQYIQLQVVQYNIAGTAFAYIGDNVYGIPSSSSTISGSFSAGANGSYTGAIVFYFSPTIASQNVKFNTFSMTRADTSITGNETVGGQLNVLGNEAVAGTLIVNNNGTYAPPSLGTLGGTGDRLILYPGNSTGYPYSLGIDANTLWYSCPTGQSQKWYVGGTNYMTLNSGGTLVLTQPSGGDQFQLINNSANAMFMNFNSNGGAGVCYIGMDNSTGTGLFGSGIGYAFDIGTATATPICFFTNNNTTPRMTISASGDTSISGNLTMNLSQVFYLYYISTTNYANMYADSSGNINFSTGTAGVTNRLQIGAGGGIIANTPITINGGGGTALIVNTSAGNPMVINGSGTDANILYNCSGAGGRQYYVGSGGTGSGGGGGNWYVYDSATGSCLVVQGSTGATGLGTNSPLPGYRLHVQGNAYVSGNIFTYGYISCLSASVYTNTVASQPISGVSQPLTLTCNIYPVCTLSSQISLSVSQQWNTYGSQLTFVPGSSASATLQNGSSILFTNGQNTGSFQLMTYGYGTANYYTTFYIYWVGGAGVYLTAGANTWSSSSDSRIKENIITMTDGLSNILKLRPVYYNFLNDKVHLPLKKRHGFIAQEYQLVYPELTDNGEHPPYKDETTGEEIQNPIGIQTTDLIADLVCAVQEQQKTITSLQSQLTAQAQQIIELTSLVNQLLKK